jgi:hypothetical protein
MPCACRVPVEKYPETADWGPLFWRVLHGLAELAGKQKSTLLQADEIRIWIPTLEQIQHTLPCDVCRTHYKQWLADHPPNTLTTLSYDKSGHWIQTYIWSLHNEINEGNGKPIFQFEDIKAAYKGVNITATWKALEPVMKKVIQLNGVSLLSWKKWLGHVRNLQGIYGV